MDDRPIKNDNEINPDVLGFIFEKYINQKDLGAYYTKEDITGYISRNTIIPFILQSLQDKHPAFFHPQGPVWASLSADPDAYIYDAVKKGVDQPLPTKIQQGVDDPSKREHFNEPADDTLGLPTEIWRETVARRKRYNALRARILAGRVTRIHDLVTYNLDIEKFLLDLVTDINVPLVLQDLWQIVSRITILDPTSGSGAFLFAALNILEPVYEAILDKMAVMVERYPENANADPQTLIAMHAFKKVLDSLNKHPSRKYYVYKSIIINNLYGVDIVEEAVEICKLRMFLKLVAQVHDKSRLEPLPDIDFNVQAGNTLVGYTNFKELLQDLGADVEAATRVTRINQMGAETAIKFKTFRQIQDHYDTSHKEYRTAKAELKQGLEQLNNELNRVLAGTYGIQKGNYPDPTAYQQAFSKWLATHKPFHWLVAFYEVVEKNKGFDVIIGNPPYVEYSKVKKEYQIGNYQTESCGNLYAYVIERNTILCKPTGYHSMIVQLSLVATPRMSKIQKILMNTSSTVWISNFDDRPGKLFDNLQHIRVSIYVANILKTGAESTPLYTTRYRRWKSEFRQYLFDIPPEFTSIQVSWVKEVIPKLDINGRDIFLKLVENKIQIQKFISKNAPNIVYYHNAPQYWIRAMDFAPYFWNEREGKKISTQVKRLKFKEDHFAKITIAILNSSLFYFWFIALSDCRHLNSREIVLFPADIEKISRNHGQELIGLVAKLMDDYKLHKERKETVYKTQARWCMMNSGPDTPNQSSTKSTGFWPNTTGSRTRNWTISSITT